MKKTHYNPHCHNPHYHHQHHHQLYYHCCHSFSAPLVCQLCLSSFGRNISHFPSSRQVTFQHKHHLQLRRLSYFYRRDRKICLFVSNTPKFLELILYYLKLTRVYTITSSISNIRVTALLLRECLKK